MLGSYKNHRSALGAAHNRLEFKGGFQAIAHSRLRHILCRRGQALIEFAIVALVLCFLMAGILSLGQMLFAAQVVQQAADVGAQELARMPLNPTNYTLNQVLYSQDPTVLADASVQAVRTQIFNESMLVVPTASLSGGTLYEYAANHMPLINQLLMPLMFFDPGLDQPAYRFPGTIVSGPNGTTTVRVLMTNSDGTYSWHAVVEEAGTYGNIADSSSFSVTSTSSPSLAGVVRLQINYPYQSAAMIAYQSTGPGSITPETPTTPILADASITISVPLPDGYSMGTQSSGFINSGYGPYSGDEGLGKMVAWGNAAPNGVRPYRRVITCNGIYRREVFGP